MDTRWQIWLFGGLRAAHGDSAVTRFRTQKTAALLAYLALHPDHSHPRDTLVDLLWPEDPLDTGRNKLRQALTSLRYQLEPPGTPKGALLRADRASIQLQPGAVTTDVGSFEARLQEAVRAPSLTERAHQLTQAAELYRGELLTGHFDPWILTERQRLQEAYLAALGQLVTLLEDMGEPERAREYARRGVQVDPLREEGQHALIRLLCRLGETGAARRQYQEWERLLEEELGEEPAAETRALLEDVERGGSRSADPAGRQPARDGPEAVTKQVSLGRTGAASVEAAPHPTGTVTFLMVEVIDTSREGIEERGPSDRLSPGLLPRDSTGNTVSTGIIDLLSPLFRGHGGHVLQASEETISVAFGRASDALSAALAARTAVARLQWADRGETPVLEHSSGRIEMLPVMVDRDVSTRHLQHEAYRLRAALHLGEVEPGEEINRSHLLPQVRQIMIAAQPAQIVLSERCAILLQGRSSLEVRFQDLGRYRLTEHSQPERYFLAADAHDAAALSLPLRALPEHTGNLPLLLSRFHGRAEELALLQRFLLPSQSSDSSPASASQPVASIEALHPPPARLVTLTGPGGSGKSRLAMEAAHRLHGSFHGAVWFVPLADLEDPRLLPDRVLNALRLPHSPHQDPLEQAAAFLARQPSLLLLDNVEHLLPAAATVLLGLLDRAPSLTLLVTSRQCLQVTGETEVAVAPLPLPRLDEDPSRESAPVLRRLIECESVALFVDRARAVRPDFQVTPANGQAVARLCERLEGLPLAIELAAARAGVMKPAQILARLEQRFDLLVSRQRDATPRHQSLRAALDWSYQLLTPELQRFFTRLSVFRGGWTLEAAEAVCLPDESGEDSELSPSAMRERRPLSAADYLEQLRQCSLVVVDEEFGEVRFRLLESLREYGAEQLSTDESSWLRRRHAEHFVAMGELVEAEFPTPRQVERVRQAEMEWSNVRAALTWTLEAQEVDLGLRLAAALKQCWHCGGYWAEGVRWLVALLDLPAAATPTQTRAKALEVTAALAYHKGDIPLADRYAHEGAKMARRLGDRQDLANSLNLLGDIALWRDGPDAALPLFEEALMLHRQIDDLWGTAVSLANLAMLEQRRADFASAERLYRDSLDVYRRIGDPRGIGSVLGMLGTFAQRAGDNQKARSYCEEALELMRDLGYQRGVAWSLNHLGSVATDEGDFLTARSCFEQSLAISRSETSLWGIGWTLVCLGDVARLEGRTHEARSYYQEGLSLHRELKNKPSIAKTLNGLALVALREQNTDEAGSLCAESLKLRHELNDQIGVVECIETAAALAAATGQAERAARLLGFAGQLRESIGAVLSPSEAPQQQTVTEMVRSALGETANQIERGRGRSLTLPEAVALALEGR